ncbi:MAG: arginine--tRNA ligase [Parcubacteria group bacterium CG1_02_40_82]|nr:MAG: arginine--tRNA ligase [Parcubacteria group bacterium CG1_02_40_82]
MQIPGQARNDKDKNMLRDEIKKILNILDAEIKKTENANFGDYSTNAALKLAKKEGKNPMEMAENIKNQISKIKGGILEKTEVAPPGFVNFFLSKEFLQKEVGQILKDGEDYGKSEIGQGKKIQVEFISANPTGPLTLGNGRGGFFGDTLAKILAKADFTVQREYFINDAGYQVEVLGHSILGDEKAQYKGEYIQQLRKKFTGFLKSKDPKKVGEKAADYITEKMIKPTVAKMKIKFDEWFSERKLKGKPNEKMLELLKEKSLTYEKEGALWFKSSEFGDDKDRVLITSDKNEHSGEATYILSDIAYHYDKFIERKFDRVVDIWGADHHGYVARLQAAKKALGMPGELEIIIMQLVRLFQGGQEIKMSKRAGTYITLDELLDEIPLDVARFFFLMYSADTHMDFNLDLAREQSEKNPVYYVQYAYARISGILKKATPIHGLHPDDTDKLKLLKEAAELDLIKQLIRLPEIIEDTAGDYQVQRLPQFALDLVRSFHKFYEECRVIDEKNPDLTQARLSLVEATRIVLKNTLELMGISAPEKM